MLLMENHRLPVSLNLLQGINNQEFSDPLKPPGPGDGIRAGRGGRWSHPEDGTRHFESLQSWCQRSMNKSPSHPLGFENEVWPCMAPVGMGKLHEITTCSKKPMEYIPTKQTISELITLIDHLLVGMHSAVDNGAPGARCGWNIIQFL